MKIEDFYGKYFLRDGDLKPEEINDFLWRRYKMTIKYCKYLESHGLLFDDIEKAKTASVNAVALIAGVNNGTYVREEDIYEAKRKPRIYISGPISGHNIEEKRKAFKEIQSHLEAQGYDPVNPMENGLPAEATTHKHMKRDIELLMTCDYIYMMRRWTHSKGCKVEFDVATAIGLPVLFEESGELIEFE